MAYNFNNSLVSNSFFIAEILSLLDIKKNSQAIIRGKRNMMLIANKSFKPADLDTNVVIATKK